MVRIKIAGSAAKFGFVGHAVQQGCLCAQPFCEHAELLAHRGRRSRLAVGMRQHRDAAPGFSKGFQGLRQLRQGRVIHLFHGVFQQEWGSRIVDVLRGESEMHKFFVALQPKAVHFRFEVVLHGFHIVVGFAFDVFDFFRFYHVEPFG